MTDVSPLTIECDRHGTRIAAVVCRHLLGAHGPRRGFVENSDEPDDLQAWCHDCEEVFEREGGLTEAFSEFNDRVMVCDRCYAELKRYHSIETH